MAEWPAQPEQLKKKKQPSLQSLANFQSPGEQMPHPLSSKTVHVQPRLPKVRDQFIRSHNKIFG